jgi:hypothetical protein
MSDRNKPEDFSVIVSRIERVLRILPIVIFCLVLAYFAAGWVLNWQVGEADSWGQFGDYIGGIMNPLIAGAALYALVVSIRIQRKELEETRKVLAEQSKTAKQERAEQRFFDLLRLYQETVQSLRVHRSYNGEFTYFGKAALNALSNFDRGLDASGANEPNHMAVVIKLLGMPYLDERNIIPADELNRWSYVLDHYFRIVFAILREAESLLGDQHFRYVKFLRAQLNRDELQLLALNMMFDREGIKMRPLAEKYGLLKHLPTGNVRTQAEKCLGALVFGRRFADRNNEEN